VPYFHVAVPTRELELVNDRKTTTLRPRRAAPVREGLLPAPDEDVWGIRQPPSRPPEVDWSPRRDRYRRRRRIVKWIALVLAVALVAAAAVFAYGLRYTNQLLDKGHTEVGGLTRAGAGQPFNVLLVGSDSREGLSEADRKRLAVGEAGGQRTDTIIVLHVSPRNRKAAMISIPRDLKVTINGRTAKVNAAFAGGPELMVRTVQQVTGLPIHHYVEINFAAFAKVVDAVGGVRVCNPTNKDWNDRYANLHLPANTCRIASGAGALAFVRARHIDSDFGRIGRQQAFIRALMAKIANKGNLINVPKILGIANIVSGNVTTDQNFSVGTALKVAKRMGSLSSDEVDMRTFPSYPDGISFVQAAPEAPILMKALREDAAVLPPVGLADQKGPTLRGTRLWVLNGGGPRGAAQRAADGLEAYGLNVVKVANAQSPTGDASYLFYPTKRAKEAQLLGALLGPQVQVVRAPSASTAAVKRILVLTVGANFQPVGPPGFVPSTPTTAP
jgi:LCP family protein required for cell wall assembly